MSTAVLVVIAFVAVAAATGIGLLLRGRARTRRLRRRFGPEYDRTVARHDDRRAAERELRARERRHDELDIRPLDATARGRYREQWVHVQEQFVDSPEAALGQADRLVITVMGDRGYPTKGFDERVAHLSVEHGRTIDYYRRGHEISCRAERRQASTEDMRQAMVHYRALLEDLLAVPAAERAEVPPVPNSRPPLRRTAEADAGPTSRTRGAE
ncbi:MAG TPA: hypothetical protein VFU43_24450 [Streptosporangiaceae bacterium]|nr:hypothetical protein [Streptosporangiaceae bacterium]